MPTNYFANIYILLAIVTDYSRFFIVEVIVVHLQKLVSKLTVFVLRHALFTVRMDDDFRMFSVYSDGKHCTIALYLPSGTCKWRN